MVSVLRSFSGKQGSKMGLKLLGIFFFLSCIQVIVNNGRRALGLIVTMAMAVIRFSQIRIPTTCQYKSVEMCASKIPLVKALLGKHQKSKQKEFVISEKIFNWESVFKMQFGTCIKRRPKSQ